MSLKVPGEAIIERAREGRVACQVLLFETPIVEEARAVLEPSGFCGRVLLMDPRHPRSQPIAALHQALMDDEPAAAIEEAVCSAAQALVEAMSERRSPERLQRRAFTAAVRRARQMLDERYTETVGLDELAAYARLDKFRLCRAFREEVGLPPHAYVTHRRVALAQDLLTQGVPQAEVAARAGFYDQSLLHRHFKRIVRVTPGEFARASAVH